MGKDEVESPVKAEKTQPAAQLPDQPAVHPYPDWAALQAYYGPGMMPPAYFGPAVPAGHAPHPYMWGPQPFIPPFGSPYAAMYPPGGIYPHPAMSIMATPVSVEVQPKSSGNKDRGSTKKHKEIDGLVIDNGTAENTGADANGHSQSGYNSAEGSTGGSDGNNASGVSKKQRKQSTEELTASGNTVGSVPPSCPVPSVDTMVASANKAKVGSTHLSPVTGAVMPRHGGVSAEHWMQDERELKRERRKQSNRESARRSRLKKQAETEELAVKVESLSAENANIRAEINQLVESSEKLRKENSALMEKMKIPQSTEREEMPANMEIDNGPYVVENFLSIIDNQNSNGRNEQQSNEGNGKPTGRLRQLLDPSPRGGAVAAS